MRWLQQQMMSSVLSEPSTPAHSRLPRTALPQTPSSPQSTLCTRASNPCSAPLTPAPEKWQSSSLYDPLEMGRTSPTILGEDEGDSDFSSEALAERCGLSLPYCRMTE